MMEFLVPLASAVVSGYMGRQQEKAQEQARKDQALINMYSPLFGQSPQALPAKQNMVMPAAMQGAMSGYQMMSQYDTNQKMNKMYDLQISRMENELRNNGGQGGVGLVMPSSSPGYGLNLGFQNVTSNPYVWSQPE